MPRRRVIDIPAPQWSDEQWEKLAEWLPDEVGSPYGGPTPVPNRPVVKGIVWVLRYGGWWKVLLREHPSTCWRRFRDWQEAGVWLDV